MIEDAVSSLPLPQRLALSYAPRASRNAFAGLFALDTRFAGIVRHAREPMLAQMRLAWWRDVLAKPAAEWPTGEPLLALLAEWQGESAALCGLAEGWECLLAEPPFGASEIDGFAMGRAECFAALTRLASMGERADDARRAGRIWALADLAQGLGKPQERESALAMARKEAGTRFRLPRALRPALVLAGLARRAVKRGGGDLLAGPADMLAALRLGIMGR